MSTFIVVVNPWFMPLLFVLAGMSARYALDCKTIKGFIAGRIRKLFIPFVVGMVCLVPVQALYARKFRENYRAGIWAHWKYFYTHCTDLTGYDGAFTPGHLWFILFLFVIAVVSLPLFRFFSYKKSVNIVEKMCVWKVLLLFIPVWMMYYLGNFGGFSIGKSLAPVICFGSLAFTIFAYHLLRGLWMCGLWLIRFCTSVNGRRRY